MSTWAVLSPLLKKAGYCVFALNYGGQPGVPFKGTGPVPDSARQIARFVDRVLKATGTRQVDLVGHSQGGGLTPRWYLRFEGGTNPANPAKNKVRRLIGLAPSNHGAGASGLGNLTTELGLNPAVSLLAGQAYSDQMPGSRVNTTLDRDGDTQPGVDYTTIVTRFDEVVTPYTNQFLTAGPGATVRNILIQEICPQDISEHISLAWDSNAFQLIFNALDPAHAEPVNCRLSAPPHRRLKPHSDQVRPLTATPRCRSAGRHEADSSRNSGPYPTTEPPSEDRGGHNTCAHRAPPHSISTT
jgi:pimeloyl-ACP methyl ester carboxylesterase